MPRSLAPPLLTLLTSLLGASSFSRETPADHSKPQPRCPFLLEVTWSHRLSFMAFALTVPKNYPFGYLVSPSKGNSNSIIHGCTPGSPQSHASLIFNFPLLSL